MFGCYKTPRFANDDERYVLTINHGQNKWQKCSHITPLHQYQCCFAQINMFQRKDLTENSYIDVGIKRNEGLLTAYVLPNYFVQDCMISQLL